MTPIYDNATVVYQQETLREITTVYRMLQIFQENLGKILLRKDDDFYKNIDAYIERFTALTHDERLPLRVRYLSGDNVTLLKRITSDDTFGSARWAAHFGAVEDTPLPANIQSILSYRSALFNGKTIQESHLLFLMSPSINGERLNLRTFGTRSQNPIEGFATKYQYVYLGQYEDPAVDAPYWVLMTRRVIELSCGLDFASQKDLAANLAQTTGIPYDLPTALEANVGICSHYASTGERLFSNSCTRTKDLWNEEWPFGVGEFSEKGLRIYDDDDQPNTEGRVGIALVWRL
jgi:hypothetical protein